MLGTPRRQKLYKNKRFLIILTLQKGRFFEDVFERCQKHVFEIMHISLYVEQKWRIHGAIRSPRVPHILNISRDVWQKQGVPSVAVSCRVVPCRAVSKKSADGAGAGAGGKGGDYKSL